MKIITLLFCIAFLVCCSREKISNRKSELNRFVKIEITDKYLKNILRTYSKSYDFGGDGVILTNITITGDTTKYVVNLFLKKEFFNNWLMGKKVVLYDTIDNRIVILATRIESYFRIPVENAVSDTLLDRYLNHEQHGIHEIWEMEYSRVDSIVKRKVVRYNAF